MRERTASPRTVPSDRPAREGRPAGACVPLTSHPAAPRGDPREATRPSPAASPRRRAGRAALALPAAVLPAAMLPAAALLGAAMAGAAMAEPPALVLPLDCELGEGCYVQNHFDRDDGPGFEDVACGTLGYDGHGGTDIALPDLAAMRAGVDVLAAASGVVLGTRDGMPDISFRDPEAPDIAGRECGNGASIDHGDGWTTQYCHMAEGSVAVRPGERVEAGRRLGRVGLSGETEFPHVHLTVRRGEARVDPFDSSGGACGAPEPETLWADGTAYVPTGVIGAGLMDRAPEWEEVKAGGLDARRGSRGAPIVLWGHAFGGRPGDLMRLAVEGPDGVVLDEAREVSRTQAAYYFAEGRRAPEGGWPAGAYRGRVEVERDGEILDAGEARFEIE